MAAHPDAGAALGIVALVPSLFSVQLPPVSVVASSPDAGGHQLAGLQLACVTSAAVVVAAAALTRSRTVLVVGAVAIVAQAAAYSRAVASPGASPGSDD